jgi:hypothetical protein
MPGRNCTRVRGSSGGAEPEERGEVMVGRRSGRRHDTRAGALSGSARAPHDGTGAPRDGLAPAAPASDALRARGRPSDGSDRAVGSTPPRPPLHRARGSPSRPGAAAALHDTPGPL